jgi:hypothetical protein
MAEVPIPASAIGAKILNSLGSYLGGSQRITLCPLLKEAFKSCRNASAFSLSPFLPKTVSDSSMRITFELSRSSIRKSEAEEIEEVISGFGSKCETTSKAKDFPQRFSGLQKQSLGA